MNQISDLQARFPLSPKKFWKKLLNSIVAILIGDTILGVVIGFVIIFLYALTQSADGVNSMGWGPVVGVMLVSILVIATINVSLYAWYVKVYIRRYYYAGEENFITIKKGVFTPAEIHVQWQKIQDVYVDQDLIDRMMGLCDVHIASATAASGIEAHIDGVSKEDAEGLKKFLLNKVANAGRNMFNVQPAQMQGNGNDTAQSIPVMNSIAEQDITFPEPINNEKYPISSKWIGVSLVSRIISSIVVITILALVFMLDSRTSDSSHAVFIAIYGAILVISAIVQVVSLFIWKGNYRFDFTSRHIYYRTGVISLSEKHMPYSSIQDVTVKQGVLERFFGLATVYIENASPQVNIAIGRRGNQSAIPTSSGILLVGLKIDEANNITNILKQTVLGKNTARYGL